MKQIIGTVIALGVILGAAFYSMPAKADTPPPVTKTRLVIKNDGGGELNKYIQSFAALKNENIAVKVDGMCASACTLVSSEIFSLDWCVTPNAVLGIHHPFALDQGGEIVYSVPAAVQSYKIWSEVFYQKYPQWLRKFIDDKGGAPDVYNGAETSDILEVPFDELSKHVGVCK